MFLNRRHHRTSARAGAGGRKHRRTSSLRPRRHRVVFQTLRAGQPQCERLKRTSPARWPLSVRLFACQPHTRWPEFRGAVVLPACDVAAPMRPISHGLPRCAASGTTRRQSPAQERTALWFVLSAVLPPRRTPCKHACLRNIRCDQQLPSLHPPQYQRVFCPRACSRGGLVNNTLTQTNFCSQERHVVGSEPGVQRRER